MDTINISQKGKERIAICQLLNEHPMYDYMLTVKKGYRNNVLLIGSLSHDNYKEDTVLNNEMFKAVFWCGQYPNCQLNITIAGANPVKLKKEFYNDQDNSEKTFYELKQFIRDKKYAKLDFKDLHVVGKNIELSGLNLEKGNYDYIIIKSDTDKLNKTIAETIKKQLQQLQTGNSVLINAYQTNVTGSVKKNGLLDRVKRHKPEQIEINYFGNYDYEFLDQLHDLEIVRLAGNIDLSYEMEFEERINIENTFKEFDIKLQEDYKTDNFSAPGNYNADSSIACAVHIPYKLNLCQEYAKNNDIKCSPLEMLMTAVNEENELFTKLAVMEHRRWNAYMLTRGYHYPSDEEKKDILVSGIKQKNTDKLWHLCLCECASEGSLLSKKTLGYWKRNCQKPKDNFSDLDKASLYYYNCAQERARQLNKDIFEVPKTEYNFLQNPELQELLTGIKGLLKDESALSIKKYKEVLQQTKENTGLDEGIRKKLETLDLNVVIERNKRRNFIETDEELIKMLPFCIWYGKKYKVTITISSGNAPDDTKIPTLLLAEKAVFVSEQPDTREEKEKYKQYKCRVQDYFRLRGNNTEIEFRELDDYSVNGICKCIEAICEGSFPEEHVLNLVDNSRDECIFAIGREGYKLHLPILKFDKTRGVIAFETDATFCSSRNKGFSVDEFLSLMGGCTIDETVKILSNSQMSSVEKLFTQLQVNVWNKCIKFLKENRGKENSVNLDDNKPVVNHANYKEYYFSSDVYYRHHIDEFLNDLAKYRIIDLGYYQDRTPVSLLDDKIEIGRMIGCFDQEVEDVISEYTSSLNTTGFIQTYPSISINNGLRIRELGKENIEIKEDSENRDIIKDFLKGLAKAGLMKYSSRTERDETLVSYCFNSSGIENFFLKEGNAWEMITFNRFKNTGLFNDLKSGVRFSWNIFEKKKEDDVVNIIEKSGKCGLNNFNKVTREVKSHKEKYQIEPTFQNVTNEIDVIAMKGMTPVFVSCKATKDFSKDYIYEICSLADHFGAIKILCVSLPAKNYSETMLYRAKSMGVSVIDCNLLEGPVDALRNVLQSILEGKIYSPLDS